MNNAALLAYFPDPFGVNNSRYLIRIGDGAAQDVTAREVSAYVGPIVTYQASVVVDDLRRSNCMPPPMLIDIDVAIRQLVGKAKDDGGERESNVWNQLAEEFNTPAEANRYRMTALSRSSRIDEADTYSLLLDGIDALFGLWTKVVGELGFSEELARFKDIEVPIQRIFHNRQARGIAVSEEECGILLKDVAREKYASYARVAAAIGRTAAGLNFWNIQSFLSKTDLDELSGQEDGGRLREYFKIAAHRSSFARDFLGLVDGGRDESILRRAIGVSGRIFPIFKTFGTVTGRILVSDPQIQQLRKKYRGMISADLGMKLAYIDFCQFEPGILAYLSNDDALIDSYNRSDIYSALSVQLFGGVEERPLCKQIFLSYLYGMTSDRIVKLVGPAKGVVGTVDLRLTLDKFFAKFSGLESFRTKSEAELLATQFVGSLNGNKRWRGAEGDLTKKERRWAMNHPVQSTASLIFKESLISLDNKFGSDSILLPMHDAVLLQFPDDEDFANSVETSRQIMCNIFSRWCPGIEARAAVESFSPISSGPSK